MTKSTETTPTRVVGLTGYAGAGKSTAANYLVERHGFTRLSFAGPLKKMLKTLDPILGVSDGEPVPLSNLLSETPIANGWTENDLKADPELGPEYRRLLQVLGTDCIRAVDPEFWVRAALAQIQPGGSYVFDDVRFPNEAEAILEFYYRGLWYVEAPGVHAANDHSSEKHAGKMGETAWLFNMPNDFKHLYDQLDHAVENLENAK